MLYFQSIDEKILKPLLLRDNKHTDPKLLETFYSIREQDAKDYIQRQTTVVEDKAKESYINDAYQHDNW